MHRPIQYTGSKDDCCPITCLPLTELRYPVSFRCASHQAYECDDLLKWLQAKQTNPLTNLKVTWESSPLELIGPLAEITPTPGRVESKICFVLEGSSDAMAAVKSITKLWLGFHISLFIIAISGIVSDQYSGFVQCLVILFAGSHWYYDAKKNGRIKKLVLVVVAVVLLTVQVIVYFSSAVVFPVYQWTWIIFAVKAFAYNGEALAQHLWRETEGTRLSLD